MDIHDPSFRYCGGENPMAWVLLVGTAARPHAKSFHEKAGECQDGFSLPPYKSFFFRAASVAILPSALFGERFSLGASWASSFQQVLLPDNRPRFPPFRQELGQDLVAVT